MRTSGIRAVAAVVVAGALVLAACGDSEDDEEGGGDATTARSEDGTVAPAPTRATGGSTVPGGLETTVPATDAAASTAPASTAAGESAADCAAGKTLEDDQLTVATGNPAFPPYVIDDEPESGEGFESAVAYAVAEEMGFAEDQVEWVRTTFDQAIQPGAKDFDLNLQQFSITPRRAQNISFSEPYYASNQAVVGFEDSEVVGAQTVEELRGLKFGAQTGTTSLGFIQDVIQPEQEPFVYNDNVAAKQALQSNQIDAIVLDLPTAFFVTAVEIPRATIIGQFPVDAGGQADEFGIVLELDNPLVECVDLALAALRQSGELQDITDEWMTGFADAPVITVE